MQWTSTKRAVFAACCVAILVGSSRSSQAQGDGKPLLTEAFEKTRSAKTVEDFGEIIRLCEDARRGQLSEQMAAYAPQLLAWAYNRRGEAYSKMAAAAVQDRKTDAASNLDQQALDDFESALKFDPDRWKARHNRGVSYALKGKFDHAIADFTAVIEAKPDYLDGWFNRAEILMEVGRFAEAIADYDHVIEMRPDDKSALLKRGTAATRLRRWKPAFASFNAAIDLDERDAAAYAGRGRVHEKQGNWEQAADDFRRAISLDQGSPEAYRSVAWLMATCPDDRFRDATRAVQAAEKAEELSAAGGDWRTFDVLAAAYANAGSYEKATQWAKQAVQLAPLLDRKSAQGRYELYVAKKPYRQQLPKSVEKE